MSGAHSIETESRCTEKLRQIAAPHFNQRSVVIFVAIFKSKKGLDSFLLPRLAKNRFALLGVRIYLTISFKI
ncbi:MAG: hypothetical protein ACXV8U_03225 [Methylobacter sp.]